MKTTKIFITTLLIALSVSIFAQKREKTDVKLKEVKVEGTTNFSRTPINKSLTVITKSEIENSSFQSIDELLEFVAGMDVRQRGVNGVQADLSIRGGSFDQNLILLNGINITDPQTGHYSLDIPIDLKNVSRIEILQGSSARVLGINSFSGAINIITDNSDVNSASLRNEAGSFGFLSQDFSLNFKSEHTRTLIAANHKTSDGYSKNTDFKTTNSFLHSAFDLGRGGMLDVQLGMLLKGFGANSFYSAKFPHQYEQTKTFFSSIRWDKKSENWRHSVQAYWRNHHDRFELFRNFEGAEKNPWYKGHNYHLTDILGGKWNSSATYGISKTTLGADVRYEHIYSNVLGTKMNETKKVPFEKGQNFDKSYQRVLSTIFLDETVNIDDWKLSAGLATTHNSLAGWYTYGGADVAYNLMPNLTLSLSANSAIRIPTFTDLFYKSAVHESNPDLKPEKSTTFEFGTIYHPNNLKVTFNGYYRIGQDVIDRIKMPNSEKWESKNLTRIDAVGFDISAAYHFQNIFFNYVTGSYSFLKMDKEAVGFDSKYALDYLKNKATLGVNHKLFSNLSANWEWMLFDRAGKYFDFNLGKDRNYDAYQLLNLKLQWQQKSYSIYTSFNNLLNKSYSDIDGIMQPKFNFLVGVQINTNLFN